MKTRNSKTQQLQALAERQVGENIRVEYKPGGLTSGWYISKKEHSYCIGKNEFEATLWLNKVPSLEVLPLEKGAIGWLEYHDHFIIRQLTDQLYRLDPVSIHISHNLASKVITGYQQMSAHNSALLALIWVLGTPLKRFVGYYPHLVLTGEKGSGKSALLQKLRESTGIKILPISSSITLQNSTDLIAVDEYNFSRQIDLLDLCKNTDPPLLLTQKTILEPKPSNIVQIELQTPIGDYLGAHYKLTDEWPIERWFVYLTQLRRSEFENIDYSGLFKEIATNNALIRLTWKLICRFSGIGDSQLETMVLESIDSME